MKKFILVMIFAFTICMLNAEEKVLFDASAKSELDGYDYISNFEMISDSGHFKKDSFENAYISSYCVIYEKMI